jgi:hypothetical protein
LPDDGETVSTFSPAASVSANLPLSGRRNSVGASPAELALIPLVPTMPSPPFGPAVPFIPFPPAAPLPAVIDTARAVTRPVLLKRRMP